MVVVIMGDDLVGYEELCEGGGGCAGNGECGCSSSAGDGEYDCGGMETSDSGASSSSVVSRGFKSLLGAGGEGGETYECLSSGLVAAWAWASSS
jgi:hypothetical protein